MKHIGIVGISAAGSALCYKLIVQKAAELFGTPTKHPEITIHNFSFYDYYNSGPDAEKGWAKVHDMILKSIEKLRKTGADFIIIPANTVHYNFGYLENRSPLPIINMVDITVSECIQQKINRPIILGTAFTIQGNLYQDKLLEKGIKPIIPNEKDCNILDNIIANNLIIGEVKNEHTSIIIDIINKTDCDSVILACTELPLVIGHQQVSMPVIDTTDLLARKAFEMALQ